MEFCLFVNDLKMALLGVVRVDGYLTHSTIHRTRWVIFDERMRNSIL